jgi:hypothetical protein
MIATTETRDNADGAQNTWQRRGLFAAVAALVAGVLARLSEQRVEAGTDGDVILGASNTTTGVTSVTNTTVNATGFIAVCDAGANSVGLAGQGGIYGVIGYSASNGAAIGAGVVGQALNSAIYGVWGRDSTSTASNVGVRGDSPSGLGVLGVSANNGVGVYGQIPSTSNANATAIYGANNSSYTGSVAGAGGFGILGLSQNGHGLVGGTNAVGAGGFVGVVS